MGLNIKNPEVERLAAEIAQMTGETKTEAIRRALLERKGRLAFQVVRRNRREEVMRFLEDEVWPRLPESLRARTPTRDDEEELLGYGHGV
ncbi:MAG: type II toxin-antitoxin system VapB family antitoxin [Gemmatimonadetes bacterium]|nr:type II toxin-antitoxin system VapB family antitoxin [Gemmatimonadota bacterium]